MQPTNFPGAHEIKKPDDMTDEECMSVWAQSGIDQDGYPYFLTAWKPSYEDMLAFNRGEPIYVKVVSRGLPPMAIFTLDENGNCNDAT